jgi:hypothetical protein
MVVRHIRSLRIVRALNCDGETFPSFEVTRRYHDFMKELTREGNSLGIVSPNKCKNVGNQILWETEKSEHGVHVFFVES